MYILNTDVLIDIQRGHLEALEWFSGLESLPSIPGFVVMELIQGAQNNQQVQQVLKLVAPLPLIWPSETDGNRALSDFTAYHLSHSLGLIDALIAATTIGSTGTLCTFNAKHYRVVPGLDMESPYKR